MLLAGLSACGLKRDKCEYTYELTSGHAGIVEAMGGNSMYMFNLRGGPLDSCQLHINSEPEGGNIDVMIIKPGVVLQCIALSKENWNLNENKNEEKRLVTLSASVSLTCEGHNYCFLVTYDGSVNKMPGMPAPQEP